MSKLLPLFPFDLVLLPGTMLPLHIFEPRYREMISECISEKKVFGIVRASQKTQDVAEIGCTAEILKTINEYSDGRLDILTRGVDRFEVVHINRDRSFFQAEVLFLPDAPGLPAIEVRKKAIHLHHEIVTLAGGTPEVEPSVDDIQLSYQLASSLPMDLDFKQNLLAMSSESERIAALLTFFETILPNLRRAVHVRQKAGGNGHAL